MDSAATVAGTVRVKEASKWNVANALTSLRLALSVWLHYRMWTSWTITWTDVAIVSIAGLTDLFDGILARYFGVVTNFGKGYDKVTDKILIIPLFAFLCCFILSLTWGNDILSAAVSLTFGAISILDSLIFLAGALLMALGLRFSSSQDGRIKMTCQCITGVIFVLLFLIRPFGWNITHPVPLLVLAGALIPTSYFALKSARGYYRDAAPALREILEGLLAYLGL